MERLDRARMKLHRARLASVFARPVFGLEVISPVDVEGVVEGEIVRQEDEIEDAQWFKLDALPNIPPRFSISGHLIRDTVERLARG